MDTLAAELNWITPVGCHFTVRGGNDPRIEDATITADLLSALAKGAMVIYIGHSLGADSALRFTQTAHNFKLPLICPVDPVSWDSNAQQVVPGRWEVGSNVERVIGYRTNTFPGGGRIALAAGNTVTNLTDTLLDVPHASPPRSLDIASSPEVHAVIVAAVHDIVTQMQAVLLRQSRCLRKAASRRREYALCRTRYCNHRSRHPSVTPSPRKACHL